MFSQKSNIFYSPDKELSGAPSPSLPRTILQAQFFARDAEAVARELIGKHIVSTLGASKVSGKIIETAAYPGKDDPDTHIYRGDSSKSAAWGAGSLYVYSSMGHALTTVATPPYNEGACVLIRAIKIVEGGTGIIDGPAKVSKALGITTALNGKNIFHGCGIEIEDGSSDLAIVVSARKGSKAPDKQLLFRGR